MTLSSNVLNPVVTDIDPQYLTVSILLRTQILQDGIILTNSDQRMAFFPGQISQVETFIGNNTDPLIAYLRNLWTTSAIEAYDIMLQNNQSIM